MCALLDGLTVIGHSDFIAETAGLALNLMVVCTCSCVLLRMKENNFKEALMRQVKLKEEQVTDIQKMKQEREAAVKKLDRLNNMRLKLADFRKTAGSDSSSARHPGDEGRAGDILVTDAASCGKDYVLIKKIVGGICYMDYSKQIAASIVSYFEDNNFHYSFDKERGIITNAFNNFEMDYRDGEIRFRVAVDCDECMPSSTVIRNSIIFPHQAFSKYGNGLLTVMFGVMTPEEAIKGIEG